MFSAQVRVLQVSLREEKLNTLLLVFNQIEGCDALSVEGVIKNKIVVGLVELVLGVANLTIGWPTIPSRRRINLLNPTR